MDGFRNKPRGNSTRPSFAPQCPLAPSTLPGPRLRAVTDSMQRTASSDIYVVQNTHVIATVPTVLETPPGNAGAQSMTLLEMVPLVPLKVRALVPAR